MKKDTSEYKRLVRFVIVLSVLLSLAIATAIFWASFEISSIKRSISDRDNVVMTELDKIDPQQLSRNIAKLIDVPTPTNGKDGEDGTDSVSTQTIVEKQTVIEKQLPGEKGETGKDGKDAKTIRLGISLNGNPIWRYDDDREWQRFELVEVDL